MMRDRVVTGYIRKRLSIQPGGLNKSEVKGRILFHSQLLLVSCIAGRNGRRRGQDHEYQKCYRGESEECAMIECVEGSA